MCDARICIGSHRLLYGIIVLVLALVSGVMILRESYRWLWYTGLGSLGTLGLTFVMLQIRIGEIRTKMEAEFSGGDRSPSRQWKK